MTLRLPSLQDRALAAPDRVERLCRLGWVGQPFRGSRRVAIAVEGDFRSIRVVSAQGTDLTPRVPVSTRVAIETHLWSKAQSVFFAMTGPRSDDQIWILDCLRRDGSDLARLSFEERWALVPRNFIDPLLRIALPVSDARRIYAATAAGPVLMRSPKSTGFLDSSTLILDGRPSIP